MTLERDLRDGTLGKRMEMAELTGADKKILEELKEFLPEIGTKEEFSGII